MSFFAATRSTSIWPVPLSWSGGVRICTSMFTSFTSKGMYCSASHCMLSWSSSWDMRGMEIFLMITLWPETPMATSRLFSLYWVISWRMASTIAVEFIKAPSTMASGGRGATPNASRTYPRFASLSWTSFTEEDPMSSPSASLLFAIDLPSRLAGTLPCRYRSYNKSTYPHLPADYLPTTTEFHECSLPVAAPVAPPSEQLPRVLQREPEREEDLALGVQPAVIPRLDAIDGRLRHPRLACELRLRHQLLLPEPLDVVHAP